MLFVAEPADVLARLMGYPALRESVEAAAEILKRGREMTIESAAGTSISVDISGENLQITRQWGYVDEPGRWDHWPSGFIACFPKDKTANGTIVLQPGDVLLPWQKYVREHVKLDIQKGYITKIHGDGADAFALRDYFARWKDPEVYALSHMGWGLHRKRVGPRLTCTLVIHSTDKSLGRPRAISCGRRAPTVLRTGKRRHIWTFQCTVAR